MQRRWVFFGFLAFLLAGCAENGLRGNDGRYWQPVAGSQIQLTQALEIPGGETRVFFQRGEVIPRSKLDYYHPHCEIEVYELGEQPRLIEKDVFVVGGFSSGVESVVQLQWPQVATTRLASRFVTGGPPSVHRYVRVTLHSERLPDVMRLTCRGAWDDLPTAEYPLVNEIKIALGGVLVFL